MSTERLDRLLRLVQTRSNPALSVPTRLCTICPEAMNVDGAGMSLLSTDHVNRQIAASDPLAAEVEELQTTYGEGPCYDVVRHREVVLEPDLRRDAARHRWPSYSGAAADAGVRAVFGFPLHVDGEAIGALDLYALRTGPLPQSAIDDALVIAELAALAVQDLRQATNRTDELIPQRDVEPWTYPSVVHHAAGMTAVQLDIPIHQAMSLIRARAFGDQLPIDVLAADIVARRLRMER